MTKQQAKLISDGIRAAVDASGMSRYAICKALGIDKGLMSRFMNGKGGLAMATLDAIADLLELEVRPRKAGKKVQRG
jgi:transcriptional regulator with XRE-family HTH domain